MAATTTKTKPRRGRGDDSIYYDSVNKCWVGAISLGSDATGKRRRPKVTGKTRAEVRDGLKKLRREIDAGVTSSAHYTVADAVRKWLDVGLKGRSPKTISKYTTLADKHIISLLGAAKLRNLTVDDLDDWLDDIARGLATSSLREVLSILRRSIKEAQRRDLVMRNVAELVTVPTGTGGRPSKSLTLEQASAILAAALAFRLYAYVVLSLLTGVRTEEARALTWDHTHLDVEPPYIEVWRSDRFGGDTKTEKSRRTLRLSPAAVDVLKAHKTAQAAERLAAGRLWKNNNLVFCSQVGTGLDAANVRRSFRRMVRNAGLEGSWTPRELRHSFVSLMSAHGVPIERISLIVGHAGTGVTEKVYRHQLRPQLTEGAEVMGQLFVELPRSRDQR